MPAADTGSSACLVLAPPDARLNDIYGGLEQQLGPSQWPGRCAALPAQVRGLSSVNPNPSLWVASGEVGVCAKALQQWTGLVSTSRCHAPGLAHKFDLDPWITDGRGAVAGGGGGSCFQASKSVLLRAKEVRGIIFEPLGPLIVVLLQQIDILGRNPSTGEEPSGHGQGGLSVLQERFHIHGTVLPHLSHATKACCSAAGPEETSWEI